MHNIFKDENGEYVVFDEGYRKGFPTYGEAVEHLNELLFTFRIDGRPDGKFDVCELRNKRRTFVAQFDDYLSALQFIKDGHCKNWLDSRSYGQ